MLRWVAITVLFVPGATAAMWLEADSTPEGLLDPEVDVLDLAFTLHVDCQHLWLRDAALEPVPAAITFEAPPEVAFWHPPQKFIPSCDPTQTTSETTIDAQVAVSRQAVGLQEIPVTVIVEFPVKVSDEKK